MYTIISKNIYIKAVKLKQLIWF